MVTELVTELYWIRPSHRGLETYVPSLKNHLSLCRKQRVLRERSDLKSLFILDYQQSLKNCKLAGTEKY